MNIFELQDFRIKAAVEEDVPIILQFIKKLARYEQLFHEVTATEELLRKNLFGERKLADVVIGEYRRIAIGFALYFHSFSTFLGRPGLYIEDLYIDEAFRGHGFGRSMLIYVLRLAKEQAYGRVEWSVLDWNKTAIQFYEKVGAVPMREWVTYRLTSDAINEFLTEIER